MPCMDDSGYQIRIAYGSYLWLAGKVGSKESKVRSPSQNRTASEHIPQGSWLTFLRMGFMELKKKPFVSEAILCPNHAVTRWLDPKGKGLVNSQVNQLITSYN